MTEERTGSMTSEAIKEAVPKVVDEEQLPIRRDDS